MANCYLCSLVGPRVTQVHFISRFMEGLSDLPQIAMLSSLESPDQIEGTLLYPELLAGIPMFLSIYENPLPKSWSKVAELKRRIPVGVRVIAVTRRDDHGFIQGDFSEIINGDLDDVALCAVLVSRAREVLAGLPA